MLRPFQYFAPRSLLETSLLLAQHGAGALLLAGGTALLPALERGERAALAVIALPRLPELRAVVFSPAEGLRLGALAPLAAVAEAALVRLHYPALARAAGLIATPGVRRLATVGGNLCGGPPSADLAVCLLALDAAVEVHGPAGLRRLPLDGLLAPWGGALLQAGEVLKAVCVPPPVGRAAYHKFTVRAAADVTLANVAAWVQVAQGVVSQVRLVCGAHGPRPARALPAEAALTGRPLTPENAAAAAEALAAWANPPDDWRASRRYRQALLRVLAERALAEAAAPL